MIKNKILYAVLILCTNACSLFSAAGAGVNLAQKSGMATRRLAESFNTIAVAPAPTEHKSSPGELTHLSAETQQTLVHDTTFGLPTVEDISNYWTTVTIIQRNPKERSSWEDIVINSDDIDKEKKLNTFGLASVNYETVKEPTPGTTLQQLALGIVPFLSEAIHDEIRKCDPKSTDDATFKKDKLVLNNAGREALASHVDSNMQSSFVTITGNNITLAVSKGMRALVFDSTSLLDSIQPPKSDDYDGIVVTLRNMDNSYILLASEEFWNHPFCASSEKLACFLALQFDYAIARTITGSVEKPSEIVLNLLYSKLFPTQNHKRPVTMILIHLDQELFAPNKECCCIC